MKYVIDTSVAFKWVVAEIDSDKALRLLTDYAQGVHELLAPDIFPTEIANSLASAEKSGRIQPSEAVTFLTDVVNNAPVIHAATPLLHRALAMCLGTRHSVYDCLYLALAEREACEFVTADDKLVRSLQPTYPFVVALASLP
jgi:predicted nucleic acid-binding protein